MRISPLRGKYLFDSKQNKEKRTFFCKKLNNSKSTTLKLLENILYEMDLEASKKEEEVRR
jgi:hypothetical protein